MALVAGVLAGRSGPDGQDAPAPGVATLVLARDLPAGAVPGRADLRTVLLPAPAVPADAIPPGATGEARGTTAGGPANAGAAAGGADGGGAAVGPLAVAVRRGDLLTRRQLGAGPARPTGTLRAYTLPVGDGVEAGPLDPGDRVDVLAASAGAPARCSARRPCCACSPPATAVRR